MTMGVEHFGQRKQAGWAEVELVTAGACMLDQRHSCRHRLRDAKKLVVVRPRSELPGSEHRF